MSLPMQPMLNIAIRAARAAGDVITRNMDRLDTLQIERKQRNDYVSEVDREAESKIVGVIRKAYPGHAILGEESGLTGQTNNDTQWIVDPLDGTTNYLHGMPYFCVSIALKVKNRLEQAVVYNPISQELFSATRGQGAWLNSKRIRVSSINKLENALLGSEFSNRDNQNAKAYLSTFNALTISCGGIRRPGAAALDLANVGAGRLDGFWAPHLKPWDVAAGALIVREAGGMICDFSGSDNWLDGGEIIAASPKLVTPLLKIVKTAHQG